MSITNLVAVHIVELNLVGKSVVGCSNIKVRSYVGEVLIPLGEGITFNFGSNGSNSVFTVINSLSITNLVAVHIVELNLIGKFVVKCLNVEVRSYVCVIIIPLGEGVTFNFGSGRSNSIITVINGLSVANLVAVHIEELNLIRKSVVKCVNFKVRSYVGEVLIPLGEGVTFNFGSCGSNGILAVLNGLRLAYRIAFHIQESNGVIRGLYYVNCEVIGIEVIEF